MSLQANVYFIVSFYCLCSACMLIVNKLAVHHIGVPAAVTISQFFATASFVGVSECAGLLQTDGFEWAKLKYFVVYVMAFSAGTWSNMKVLMVSNVETVIVFRSCAPLVVCIFDYLFHNRALPSARSAFAMCLIVGGAAMYVARPHALAAGGTGAYFWVGVWFSLLVFWLTYGKYLVSGLGLKSVWSPVLYTNLLARADARDRAHLRRVPQALHVELRPGVTWLLVSCVVGTGIVAGSRARGDLGDGVHRRRRDEQDAHRDPQRVDLGQDASRSALRPRGLRRRRRAGTAGAAALDGERTRRARSS